MKYRFCIALCGILIFVSSFSARAVPGDEHWDSQFNWPGPGAGNSAAIAAHNGLLYASVTSSPTNILLQVWDGLQWTNLAQVYGPSAIVFDLTFVGDTLYVAGTFTNVNGTGVTNLARWNGAGWSSFGFSGGAYALASDGINLYVGGSFTNRPVTGLTATNVAYWDGSAWHALGNGLGITDGNAGVNSFAFQGGLVYAGGLFVNSGSQPVTNLAVWNGLTWTNVGAAANNTVYALAFNGPDLYVGGAFSQMGSTPANAVARWNGTGWSALGTGMPGGVVNRLAVLNGRLYASGAFNTAGGIPAVNIASWNGSAWSALGSGVSAAVSRIVSAGSNLYVGGTFLFAGGLIVDSLGVWDGAHWSALGTPGRENGVSSAVISIGGSGTNLLIGGLSFSAAGQTSNTIRIARFDGHDFHPIGPGLNSNVLAVAAVGTNYYAGGFFTGNGSGSGPLAYHMAHWDGTNWSSLKNTAFAGVARLVARGDDLFIAGYFGITGADGTDWWLTRWDGTNFWNVLTYAPAVTFNNMAFDNIGITALAIDGTNIYASGQLTLTECDDQFNNCTSCVYAVHYDGTYAWPMGTGLNSNATSIAIAGTNVYFAGGAVTNAGGVVVSQIARWDGFQWHNVGGGVVGRGAINALAAVGDDLYAGGTFTNMGGVTVNRMARWDGTAWSPLGGGVSTTVSALYTDGSDLYVGGNFRIAGNKPAFFLGRWNDQENFNVPQISALGEAGGQFRMRLAGTSGLTNLIEATTNFTAWTPILTNSVGLYDFTDPASAGYPRRFYRARLGP